MSARSSKHRRNSLTQIAVEQWRPDPNKRIEIADPGKRGLYLVVQPSGVKSWAVRYRRPDGMSRKYTLEGFPSLKTAHKLAQEVLDQVAEGHDPAAIKQLEKQAAKAAPSDDSYGGMARKFITRYARPKNRTWREVARLLGLKPDPHDDKQLIAVEGGLAERWSGRKFGEITRRDIVDLLDDIIDNGGGFSANRTLASLRKMWNWAASRDDRLPPSPCTGVAPPVEEARRDRVLTDDEIRWLWFASDKLSKPFGRAIKLMLLTGQRRTEVAGMSSREVDRVKRLWTIPGVRTKNGETHTVPLSDAALGIINSVKYIGRHGHLFTTNGELPISGWAKCKQLLDKHMAEIAGHEIEERWTLHDLRRTAATGMARLGIALPTIEKVLNHKSGSFAGIVAVYQLHDYSGEKREALESWAHEVERIVCGKKGG